MSTVIIGAGIIGTSTAYYLSQSKPSTSEIHLVEASPELFASASGYAAGFLARDWFSPSLAKLGELSFDLHKQLAEENNGYEQWGYSRSSGTSLAESIEAGNGADWLREGASRSTAAARSSDAKGGGPTWLRRYSELDVMSDGSTTAQVDPLRLCRFLMESCLSRGVHLHQPVRPLSILRSSSGAQSGVEVVNTSTGEKSTIPCSHIVIAAGAWSSQVYQTLFPKSKTRIPITSLAGHSLVLQSPQWPPPKLDDTETENPSVREDCHAVFTTDTEGGYSPELFSRMPDGHIYLAGLNSSHYPLPKIANERVIDSDSIAALKKTAHRLLGDDFKVVRESVCWRPVAKRGVPIIAELEKGVFLCAGHGPWGISNSLGSGYCVASMVRGVDVERYTSRLGV
ncbi:hypothetical protein P7C71_g4182, partial [Lecanoromycetidae sp. Uapishka_2]